MTTIATDGKTIAADSRAVGNFILQGNVNKLKRLKDGRILGTCGELWETHAVAGWLDGKRDKPKVSEGFGALVLGESLILYRDNLEPMEIPPPYSIGSGCGHAIGAMLAGASPREAIKISIKLDENTGGRIRVMEYAKSRPKA